jgi:hypothetical protein
MAIGDIAGDLVTAWMTPAQRAAQFKGLQPQTAGPISRVSELATAGTVAGGAIAASQPQSSQFDLNPNPTHLGDIFKNPAQLAQPPQTQSLASAGPVGVTPTATSPAYPTNSQVSASLSDALHQGSTVSAPGIQQPINAVTAGADSLNFNPVPDAPPSEPVANEPQSLDNAFRLTGTGANAIAARIGANGVPEFSNQSADLDSASRQAPISQPPQQGLADAWRDSAPGSGPQFAALGSASNLGDGIGGGLSVGAPGDSQLALTRFQRANDIRSLGAAQDRADLANYRANQGAQIGIVRDSSRPITRSDLAAAQLDQQKQAGLVQSAGRAQQSLEDLRTGITAATQTRQANRLEDALTMATAPNATDAARQNYRTLTDPDGSKALARQLTQAQIDEKNAAAQKLRAEASAAGGPGKLTEQQAKDLQFFSRGNAANAELANFGDALTGTVDSLIRGIPVIGQSGIGNTLVSSRRQQAEQAGQDFLNSLLRKDSGAAITAEETDLYGKTYLPRSGDSEAVLRQKHAARERALQGIRDGLGSAAVLTAETNRPDYKSASTGGKQTQSSGQPIQVKNREDLMGLPSGTLFVTPDGKTRRIP